eukprot:TRINITY_DN32405_c0_g2_i1.p1 TRINITY_DN32405_c0_g2~~TRINITY_DN32405_c0_g2_i1.p1  ORF type:complete len:237 (-),score=34.52 TRINITY_DN32405_c0_g2_i1:140-850(-)
MRAIQYSSQKELHAAKKILYEGDAPTKKMFITVLFTLLSLFVLLILSILGTTDQWTCEVDSRHSKHDYICGELRRAVNCKTVSGPIRAEVFLQVGSEAKANAVAVCPWEIAISELRFCFVLMSILCSLVGLYAIRKESRKYAEVHFQSAIFFAVVLLIAAFFDYVSISNSRINNFNLCTLSDEFEVDKSIKGESMECTFNYYYATVIAGVISAGSLLYSSHSVNKWRETIVPELLN